MTANHADASRPRARAPSRWLAGLLDLFAAKNIRRQVGALVYVDTPQGPLFLLTTTRRSRRWIIPKGWPGRRGIDPAAAAAREAREECGIDGDIAMRPCGRFDYWKELRRGVKVRCRVSVYPLRARLQRLDWPERGQRQAEWLPRDAAAARATFTGLAHLIRGFVPPRPDDA